MTSAKSSTVAARSPSDMSHAGAISQGAKRNGGSVTDHVANSSSILVLPILNVDRRSLRLRNEITFWLSEAAKLDLQLVICKDEVNWQDLAKGKRD